MAIDIALSSPTRSGRHIVVAGAIILALFLTPFALFIRASESNAERALSERFQTRSSLTASFARDYVDELAARERAQAERLLAGAEIDRATFEQAATSLGFETAMVLDHRGRLLQVLPSRPELIGQDMTVDYAHLRAAVAGEVSVSQMVPSAAAGLPVVGIATPYDSAVGRRVFSGAFPPGETPFGAYFSSAVPISGGGGFLIDRAGNVLANAHETKVLPTGVEAGTEGITHLETDEGELTAATSPVTGAPWTVVLTAPSDSLYGPVRDGRWAPWAMLLALAVTGAIVLALCLRLEQARAAAGRSAHTDALTGLPNRRAMDEVLQRAAAHADRRNEPLSALMIDVDHFKRVNDQHGHTMGDGVLRDVAETLRHAARDEDTVGRWGGEEFLVVLQTTASGDAGVAAERLRAAVEAMASSVRLASPVTVSIGVSSLRNGHGVIDLLRDADSAMYRAKSGGRNAVEVAGPTHRSSDQRVRV